MYGRKSISERRFLSDAFGFLSCSDKPDETQKLILNGGGRSSVWSRAKEYVDSRRSPIYSCLEGEIEELLSSVQAQKPADFRAHHFNCLKNYTKERATSRVCQENRSLQGLHMDLS